VLLVVAGSVAEGIVRAWRGKGGGE
jgi:hypothetical protein